MSNEVRGSDKLKTTCSTLTTLEQDELEQVVGGYSGPLNYMYVFPRGIPWPDFFNNGLLDQGMINPVMPGKQRF